MITTNCPTCGSKVGVTNNSGTDNFIVLYNESKDQQIKDLEELISVAESSIKMGNAKDYSDYYYRIKEEYQQKYPKQ